MATNTPKLGLKKPNGTEYVTLSDLNRNWDTLDANAASQEEVDQLSLDVDNLKVAKAKASDVSFTPTGSITANNVQDAISQAVSAGTVVGMGTVGHGGTIPYPAGIDPAKYNWGWIVSMNYFNAMEADNQNVYFVCQANASRQVTCYYSTFHGQANGTANYLIIGTLK